MQPPQGDDTGNAVASHPRYQYSPADLQILHEIISLATVFPGKNSFRAIYRAYDVVLAARKINPAFDSVYFRFILQLQSVPGKSIYDRFTDLLSKQGVDVADGRFLETPSAAATAEFTRQRYDTARRRRDRSSHGTTDVSSDDYHASTERARRPRRSRRSLTGLASSPTHEATIAAELAARTRREEVSARRGRRRSRSVADNTTAPTTENEEEDEQDRREDDDNDVEEIQRPRVPEDAADALYALRMKAVLRDFFKHWHAETVKRVEQKWFAVVERRAERRYNTILVAKAWSVWIQKTAMIVQRTQEVRQRVLVRKYFNAWRALVIENEEKVRLFQLSNALYKWRDATKKRRQVAQVAQRVYQENLVHRAYWTWFFQLCGILGMRRYHKTIREQYFDTWVEKTEKIIQMNRMANAFYRRHTLQTVFNQWSEKTLHCLDAADIAADHSEWKLTEKTFDGWRRKAKFAPIIAIMTEYVNDRVMHDHFALWRLRAQQSISAASMARTSLLKNTFKAWRLRLRSKILTEQTLDKLEFSTLRNWVLQTRYRQFKAWKDSNLARKVLAHWLDHYHRLDRRLEQTGMEVVVSKNAHLARSVLTIMQTRIALRQQMAATAANFRAQSLLTAALARWRLKADLCRMYNDWADDAIYYFTARRALRQWKHAFRASRRARLRAAFHTVSRHTKRNLAASALSLWLSRTDHILTLTAAATDFAHEHTEAVAATQLALWRDRADALDELHAVAEDHNRARLLRLALDSWRDRLAAVDEMHERAAALHDAHSGRVAAKYFERWGAAAWRLTLLRLSCERFERKRAKALFRNWKNAALERHERRRRLHEERRGGLLLDETLDEAFGPEWMRPLPLDVSAQQQQDLGRSIFGTSIRGQGQALSLRQSVLGRSALGRSIGGSTTPVAQTPGWRTTRRGRTFSSSTPLETPRRGAATVPQTPRNGRGETPGSPLMRFSRGFAGLPAMSEEFE